MALIAAGLHLHASQEATASPPAASAVKLRMWSGHSAPTLEQGVPELGAAWH